MVTSTTVEHRKMSIASHDSITVRTLVRLSRTDRRIRVPARHELIYHWSTRASLKSGFDRNPSAPPLASRAESSGCPLGPRDLAHPSRLHIRSRSLQPRGASGRDAMSCATPSSFQRPSRPYFTNLVRIVGAVGAKFIVARQCVRSRHRAEMNSVPTVQAVALERVLIERQA